MADITIDSSVHSSSEWPTYGTGGAARMSVDTDHSTVYEFYTDSNGDIVYKKTTDALLTFSSTVVIHAFATSQPLAMGIWYDKWTSGNTGTKIHLAWMDEPSNDIVYNYLDTSGDTLGTEVSTAQAVSDVDNGFNNSVTRLTVARGGNIYILALIDRFNSHLVFLRSTDSGASFSARTASTLDNQDYSHTVHLVPGNYADNQDIDLFSFYSAFSGIRKRTYDDSADTWDENVVEFGNNNFHPTNSNQYPFVSVSIRHSDGHAIVTHVTEPNNVAADVECYDVSGATATQMTNISTNTANRPGCQIYIDQNTDDIYAFLLGNPDGSDTFESTMSIWYLKSTDGGTTWGSPVAYSEDTPDDYRTLSVPHCSPGAHAGLVCCAWYDDDDDDLFTNAANAVQVGSGASFLDTVKDRYSALQFMASPLR